MPDPYTKALGVQLPPMQREDYERAVLKAIADEREACAKLADAFVIERISRLGVALDEVSAAGAYIAAQIRARKS